MENKIKFVFLGGIITILCIIGLIINSLFITGNSVKEDTIKIGNIGILTGEGSTWGIAAKNGIELAVKDINSNGGINGKKLVALHEDDSGDSKKTISAFQKLTEINNVNIIIGTTWSSTGIPLIKLADNKKVLIVSPSLGKPEFNEGSKYLFNTWPHDVTLSANLADYVFNKGHKNIALIGAEELWVKDQTNAFTKRFNELGGNISVLVEPSPKDKDLNSEALKIKNALGITAIVSTTDGVLVGSLVEKRAKEIGVNLPIYSVTIDSDSIKSANGAYEGMEFLTFLTPTNEFKERYEKTFNTQINIGADSAYDATMIIAKGILETKSTDSTKIANYIESIKEYEGVSGKLISDNKHGFTKDFVVMKVINGTPIKI